MARRRIGFLSQEEIKQYEVQERIENHEKICNDYAERLYHLLLIQDPDTAKIIMQTIDKILYN